jgi:sugar/nucleoside kinase (ribokinase family)
MIELATVGWLTIDDIVLPDRTYEQNVLGGGALYSAVGALIWRPRVGVHSVTGRKYFDDVVRRLAAYGLETAGITAIPGNGLELWLLHESESDKQQVPKLSSSTAAEMDAGRAPLPEAWHSVQGVHIAPQSPAGSFANLDALAALDPRPVLTLDLLSDAYVNAARYRDLGFLERLAAFLPSEAEIARIWQPVSLAAWVREQALRHRCHVGAKLGADGSLVCDGRSGQLYRVPAFPAAVVDTTGAGDAYCGGFLVGLVETGDPLEAAVRGSVSASFVIEGLGFPVREPMLAAGQVDAITGFSFSSYINLKDRGVPADDITVMLMADHGVNLYGNAIIVNPKFAAEKPEVVKKFLNAFLKGLKDTVKSPDTAVDSVIKRNDVAKKPVELERLKMAIKDNIVTPEVKANGFGGVDSGRLDKSIDQIAITYDFKNAKPKGEAIFDPSFLPPAADRKL